MLGLPGEVKNCLLYANEMMGGSQVASGGVLVAIKDQEQIRGLEHSVLPDLQIELIANVR